MSTAITLRASIDEIEGHRTRSLEYLGRAFDLMNDALRYADMAAPSIAYGMDIDQAKRLLGGNDREKFLEIMRQSMDRRIWRHLLEYMGLGTLMDRQARKEFEQGLETNPPEATAANCFSTMSGLVEDAELIFRRGLANAFSSLDRRFRSHDGFKIGARICLSYALSDYGHWGERARGSIQDVERVFHVLDGVPPPEYHTGIVGIAEAAAREIRGFARKPVTVENAYFRLRTFKNGNAHLWFKRDDLVRKVNQLLGEYYGATLGAGADADHPKHHAPRTGVAPHFGEFFTPNDLARRLVEEAQITRGMRVLEPSAGAGAIAKHAAAAGGVVTCVEIQRKHAESLTVAGLFTYARDFMELEPSGHLAPFDRIIMNPPFDRGRDVDHVTHALKFLTPGGILIAVMSASTEHREDAKTADFRATVKRMGGVFCDLPERSFAESGTNANALLCVIGRGTYFRF